MFIFILRPRCGYREKYISAGDIGLRASMQLLLNLSVSFGVESENVLSSVRNNWFVLGREKISGLKWLL